LTKAIRRLAFERPIATDQGPMRLILGIGGHYKNVLCLSPSLEISRADVDRAIAMLDVLIAEAKA
jgi:4-aminobutyrate aminotransferase / (S)-3-amino-2-methylpropionate transaminase / 5-aminovalerate transaminase